VRPIGRATDRQNDEIRPVALTLDFMPFAEGSALIQLGLTRVVCTASVEEAVPPFLRGQGVGWVTAEYRMLPRSTLTRTPRETAGRLDGRSIEIQRLIGRSLRAAVDRTKLGERTITIDCDVLTADGGTRTAAITGGFVALALAVDHLRRRGTIDASPIVRLVAAISAGIVGGEALLDLDYDEDSAADVDCNAVLTERGEVVEFQLSSERTLATARQADQLLQLTTIGVEAMRKAQIEAVAQGAPGLLDLVRVSP
jgi:ribonuclease PH